MADFVAKLLLGQEGAKASWNNVLTSGKTFYWTTQRQIIYQDSLYRLDLLLEVDRRPTLVVESKIGHHLAVHQHRQVVDDSDAEAAPSKDAMATLVEKNQLSTYGHWLASQSTPDRTFQALAFVTHLTAPPNDFGKDNYNYGVAWTRTCRWSEIWRWLTEKSRGLVNDETAGASPAWMVMAKDLAIFIEVNGMSAEMLTLLDISKVEVFIETQRRMNATFRQIYEQIRPVLADHSTGRANGYYDYTENGVIWSWAYLKPPLAPKDWSVAWGLRFPSVSDWWKGARPPLPHTPHVFVNLRGEKTEIPISYIPAEKLPKGWSTADETNELVAGKAIYAFPAEPDEMNNAMAEWVKVKVEEAFTLLKSL